MSLAGNGDKDLTSNYMNYAPDQTKLESLNRVGFVGWDTLLKRKNSFQVFCGRSTTGGNISLDIRDLGFQETYTFTRTRWAYDAVGWLSRAWVFHSSVAMKLISIVIQKCVNSKIWVKRKERFEDYSRSVQSFEQCNVNIFIYS